jgi:hypothetical protein
MLGMLITSVLEEQGALYHTARATMCKLSLLFGDRIISKGLWPPRSPEVSPPDYFCIWGHIKDNAYRNNTRNLDKLKTNISNIIAYISPLSLQAVSTNMLHRAGVCMQNTGAHF